MKRLHFLASYSTFFVGLFMFLIFTAMEKALGQNLVATNRLSLTLPSTAGTMYDLSQFPDFSIPNGKKVIFAATGRLTAVNSNSTITNKGVDGDKIFKHGYTHLNHIQMTYDEFGRPSPGSWYQYLPKNKRAFVSGTGEWSNLQNNLFGMRWTIQNKNADGKEDPFYDYYENNPNSSSQVFKYAVRSLPGYFDAYQGNLQFGTAPQGLDDLKDSFDVIIWDNELHGDNSSSSLLYNYSSTDYSPGLHSSINLSTDFKVATANRYVYMLQQTQAQAPNSWIGSYDPGAPFNSFGKVTSSNYSNPSVNVSIWDQQASNAYDTNSNLPTNLKRNVPSGVNSKKMSDYANIITPTTYFLNGTFTINNTTYTYYDFNYSVSHSGNDGRNWLAYTIGNQEVNSKLISSSHKRVPFYWLFSEHNHEPAPAVIAEGTAVFPWFTNIDGMVHWDDFQGPIISTRTYDCYVHFVHGLYRLFSNHKDMFEGSPTYLQDLTDFKVISVTNPNTNNNLASNSSLLNQWVSNMTGSGGKSEAWFLKDNKLPFVRSIVKDCEILVAASYPYSDANTQTKIVVQYASKNWVDTLTLNGDEIYIGRATMKPSLVNVTVNGSSNVSTPIFISPGSHTIYVAPSTNNTTYSYSVIYPSNSSVQLYPNGNYCQFNTNGATGSFYIRISATNECGTTTRDLVFVVQSGYRAYSNPTKDYLSVTFDNAKNIEGLPDSIELLPETSTKAVKGVVLKDIYDKNAFKNGDTVEFDVRTLAKGTYYLHLKYTTPASILAQHKDAQQKSKTDVVRIIIN